MKHILLGGLFLLMSQLPGQSTDVRLNGLKEEVSHLMATHQTVGMSVCIVENDQVIFSESFGYRDYGNKIPVTNRTIFPIGSITKPITASLIGAFTGQYPLHVKDKPRTYIPYLEFATCDMNKLVTLEDLLAHRSGIGVTDGAHVFFPTDNIEQHLKRLPHLRPNSQVRERFDYSNMGYAILGEISAKISGETWAANIQNTIFNPLQMEHSNCSIADLESSDDPAVGYGVADGKIIRVAYEDQHESVASGGINSTAEDLSNWVKMLLNRGVYHGKQIVPTSYLESSFSEHNIIRGSFGYDKKYELLGDSYGYGWFVHQYKGLYRVHHEGNVSGFTSSVMLYPYKNIGIILLTNQGSANLLTRTISNLITNRLLGLKGKRWNDHSIQIGQVTLPSKKIKSINSEKPPTHPLHQYGGKYHSKGYGTAEVFLEKENLMIQFPAFTMALEHQQYNTFVNRVIEVHHQNTPSFSIRFYPDDKGAIAEMTIGFAPEPEKFIKVK